MEVIRSRSRSRLALIAFLVAAGAIAAIAVDRGPLTLLRVHVVQVPGVTAAHAEKPTRAATGAAPGRVGRVGDARVAKDKVRPYLKRRPNGTVRARGWVERIVSTARDHRHGEGSTTLVLNTGDRTTQLSGANGIQPGDVVTVSGTMSGQSLEVRSLSAAGSIPPGGLAPATAAAFSATRTERLLVLPLRFTGDAPGLRQFPSTADLTDAVFGTGANGSLRQYFSDSSHGNVLLQGDVQEPVTIHGDPGSSCAYGRWIPLANAASRTASSPRDPDSYDRVVYLVPNEPGCKNAGESASPGRWTVTPLYFEGWNAANRKSLIAVLAHEVMHQFGLFHENTVDCSDPVSQMPTPMSLTCSPEVVSGGADGGDLMSSGQLPMSGTHRLATGFLPTSDVNTSIDPTVGGAFQLRAVDGGAAMGGLPRLLRIPLKRNRDDGDPRSYLYLETRALAVNPFDGLTAADSTIVQGVALRTGEAYEAGVMDGASHFFKTIYPAPGRRSAVGKSLSARAYFKSPGTLDGENRDVDAGLRSGQSYYDPLNNFTVTVTTPVTAASTTVTVTPGPVPATTASQTSVAIVDGELQITGMGTRRNAINIGAQGTTGPIYVADYGNRPTAGAGCTQLAFDLVRCSRNAVRSVRINAGDGDDVVAVQGDDLKVPTVLDGGAGSDSIQGGAGDDLIDGGAGADWMLGGPGVDTVTYASRPATERVTIAPVRQADTALVDGSGVDFGNQVAVSGAVGENDGIGHDVENGVGGRGADTFITNDQKSSQPDPYVVDSWGNSSVDRVFEGGLGADRFTLNGAGRATVVSLDGVADAATTCGSAPDDLVIRDSADPTASGCETTSATVAPTLSSPAIGRMRKSPPFPTIPAGPVTWSFSHPLPTATFECKLETGSAPGNGAYSACSTTNRHTTTALASGIYAFSVRSKAAGATPAGPAAVSVFAVTPTPPVASFKSGPLDGSSSADRSPEFGFSAAVGSSFECRIGTGAWTHCPQTYTVPQQTGSTLTLAVRAVSSSGVTQTATPQSRTILLTGAVPGTTVSGTSAVATVTKEDPSWTFSGTPADVTFECRRDFEATWEPCESPFTPGNQYGLPSGLHVLRVRAVDAAGNVDPTPEVRPFDVVPGVKLFSSVQWEGATRWTNTLTGTLPFAIETAAPPGTFRTQCQVGFGSWTSCSAPNFSYDLTGQTATQSTFSFAVRVLDGTNAVVTKRVWPNALGFDNTPPPFTVGVLRDGSKVTPAGAMADLSSTEPMAGTCERVLDPSACVAGYDAKLDNGPWVPVASSQSWSSGPLANGSTHTAQFRVRDLAGNTATVQRTFSVANPTTPATVQITPDVPWGSWVNTRTPGYSFSVNDQGFSFRYLCVARYPTWEPCQPGHFTAATSSEVPPAYDAGVRVIDAAGGLFNDPSATYRQAAYLADMSVPRLSVTKAPANGATITDLAAAEFAFSTPDSTDGTSNCQWNFASTSCVSLECKVNDLPFAGCSSPFTGVGVGGNGTVSIQIRARDLAGNATTSSAYSYTLNAGNPPDTSISGAPTAPTNAPITLNLGASPASGATWECRPGASGPWAACGPTYSSPPGASQGIPTLQVRAKGPNGAVDATPVSLRWVLDKVAPDTIVGPGTLPGEVLAAGRSARFEFSIDNSTKVVGCLPANPAFSDCPITKCKFDAGPWETCQSPFISPALTAGEHTFRVQAIDSAGNADPSPVEVTFRAAEPTLAFISPSPPDSGAASRTPTLAFVASLPGLRVECVAQGYTGSTAVGSASSTSNCISPWTVPAPIQGTTGLIAVRAVDAGGNEVVPWQIRSIASFTN
jgi:Ca2+-binding RTX toxin-like protein